MILSKFRFFSLAVVISYSSFSQNKTPGKECFSIARQQLETMLSGKEPLNYEKAVFLTENAFYNNDYRFDDFKFEIDLYSELIKWHYRQNNKKTLKDFNTTLIETAEAKYHRHCENLLNYSIYTFLADTVKLVDGDSVFTHAPYSYSFTDPTATKNWGNSQVMNLLFNNKTGNCYALTSLFKIFSERLHSNAFLTTAPNHIFISHKDEKNITYNVELASKAFPGNGSIEALTYTTDKAIKSHIAMRALSLKQSVALNLIYLAKSYQHKYGIAADEFLSDCADSALKFDSLCLNAMLLKAELLEENLFVALKENKITDFNKMKSNASAKDALEKYEAQIKTLFALGYLEMPVDMKNIILSGYNKDVSLALKNNTPTAIQSTGALHDKDYITVSGGLFDENPLPKEKERYSRVIFDTKRECIIGFTEKEQTYNNYNFDPVLFALSIDPMSSKYAFITPYSAFSNNPIIFVDADGNDNIVYLIVANGTKSKVSVENAKSIAAEANKSYENLGLKTRVVVVTDANFNSKYINSTDAVAIYGSTKQQQQYLDKQGPHVNLFKEVVKDQISNGYGSSGYPELSQNQTDYNRTEKKGGEFILINEQALPQYAKDNNSSLSEAGAFLLLHGAGHNSGVDHNAPGNMISSEGSKVFSTLNNGALTINEAGIGVSWPNESGFKSVVDFMRNKNVKTGALQNEAYKSAITKRFGSNTAQDNYNANKKSCESECK